MNKKQQNIEGVIEDLLYIKTAIAKNSNIFKFISITEILKTMLLVSGLIIIGISGGIYTLIQQYGGFQQIPRGIKSIIYLILILTIIATGTFKSKKILGAARHINQDISLGKLMREIYTIQSLVVIIPFVITMGLTTVFFVNYGHINYIVPFLAIFVGLLCNSMVNIFHLRELFIFGGWLIFSGLIALLGMLEVHPLLMVIFTFGIGMILMYVAIVNILASEKE